MKNDDYIPFNLPEIGDEEIQEVTEALRSGWLTTGPKTAQFEMDFRQYTGASHALAVNSCTAGLHVALAALGVGPGDEVITTPLTFCSTVHTIGHTGATPVLADVGADGNIDPSSVAERITSRTRAIIPVHLAGLPCDMTAIWQLACERGLAVVEDAAHAVGTEYLGSRIGGYNEARQTSSDAVAFSFYATKNLTTGEGGMVTTENQELADTMRRLSLHGMSRDAWKRYDKKASWYYQVMEPGFKYNLSDILSAVGIAQLRKLERFTAARTRYAQMYNELFADVEELEAPPDNSSSRHAWHLYMLRLNLERLGIDRDEFMSCLRDNDIGASVHFIPIPLHPAFQVYESCNPRFCPRALQLYPRLVSLPLYPAMTEEQVKRVATTVKNIVWKTKTSMSLAMKAGR